MEYLAAMLSQSYHYPWLGALVLTALIGTICLAFRGYLIRMQGAPVRLLAYAPALTLLVMLNHYGTSLSALGALCAAVVLAWLYSRTSLNKPVGRFTWLLLLYGISYWLIGGTSLVFAAMSVIFEIGVRRAWLVGATAAAASAVIPYLAGRYWFQTSTTDAYLRLSILQYDLEPIVASIATYAFLLLVPVYVKVLPWLYPKRCSSLAAFITKLLSGIPLESMESKCGSVLRTSALVFVAMVFAVGSQDKFRRAIIAVDFHVRAGDWKAALKAGQPLEWTSTVPGKKVQENLVRLHILLGYPLRAESSVPILPSYNAGMHDINLALVQTGQLLDRMFAYPQLLGMATVRLLPDSIGAYVAHSYNMDVLMALGHVNEAERVTCESLANIGPRPWLLRRLALINILKDRPEAARVCLTIMARDPYDGPWARTLLENLQKDPALKDHQEIQSIRERMFKIDQVGELADMAPDEQMLRYLLVSNPHNRVAFDYLMAYYLLTLKHDKIAEYARYIEEFGYREIPRHCEEAILLHMRFTGKQPDLRNHRIRDATFKRFEEFQRDLDALGGPSGDNKPQVRDALLSRYADTYWFFCLFGDTFFGKEHSVATSRTGDMP